MKGEDFIKQVVEGVEPVDHQRFITGFDVAGFRAAINDQFSDLLWRAAKQAEIEHERHIADIHDIDGMTDAIGTTAKEIERKLMRLLEKKYTRVSNRRIVEEVLRLIRPFARAWDTTGRYMPGTRYYDRYAGTEQNEVIEPSEK